MNLIHSFFLSTVLLVIPIVSPAPVEYIVNPIATTTPVIQAKRAVVKRIPTEAQIALINQKAEEYGVSADLMIDLISCESDFVEDVQSKHINKNGQREQSFGLVQIHLPDHPNITYEQAINPEFAVDFMAKNISLGNADWMWSCYKLIASR